MKTQPLIIFFTLILLASCTSQKKLAYLQNLPEPNGIDTFPMAMPDYKVQPRDILFITAKAMTPEGTIKDFLSISSTYLNTSQGESTGAFFGFNVDPQGYIAITSLGRIKVSGLTVEEIKLIVQAEADKVYKNTTVDCKLLSFKFTVIGEVKIPGAYINYNNYLTVLEAIGRAGGVSDLGNRDRALVVRTFDKGTKTYRINLQDKSLLTSEAYFLQPNDVVIIEPMKQKIFNMNLPTLTFFINTTLLTISTTLLLINYFGN
jgi:polysaccharide biosynthesis/export protein